MAAKIVNFDTYKKQASIWYFSRIHSYSTVSTSDAVYIVGGDYTPDIVAEYNDDRWRLLDHLKQGRHGHGSVMVGDQTMIIGGRSENGT